MIGGAPRRARPADRDRSDAGRGRRIGAAIATTVVVGSMVGTGVFTTTGLLLADLGAPLAVLAAWAVGGLLAVCGALSYAELAAALPRNGGEYQLLARIYHPAAGFVAGVVSLVVGFSAPLAASSLAFGRYLAAAFPGVAPTTAALAVLAAAAALHGVQVRFGARAQGVLTAAEVLLAVALAVATAARGDPGRLLETTASGGAPTGAAFAAALVYVSFAYSGWNGAAYLAGEVARPARTLPVALVGGTAIVVALYLGLNLAFLVAAPPAELAGVVEVAQVAAARSAGPGAGRAVAALVALCLASSVGATLLAGSRVQAAIGADHPALGFLSRRTRGGAPAAAVGVQAAVAAALILTTSFAALLAYVGFTLSVVSGACVVGVVVLRRREPGLARPYRTWGYPVTPLLFVTLSAWMVVHAVARKPAACWAGLATLGGAALAYAVLRRARCAAAARAGDHDRRPPGEHAA
jgi:APA family basic amino acid/polyamine antiporter